MSVRCRKCSVADSSWWDSQDISELLLSSKTSSSLVPGLLMILDFETTPAWRLESGLLHQKNVSYLIQLSFSRKPQVLPPHKAVLLLFCLWYKCCSTLSVLRYSLLLWIKQRLIATVRVQMWVLVRLTHPTIGGIKSADLERSLSLLPN